jgi:hypothetical protein
MSSVYPFKKIKKFIKNKIGTFLLLTQCAPSWSINQILLKIDSMRSFLETFKLNQKLKLPTLV